MLTWEAEVDDPQGMLASKSSYDSELQVQCLHMYKQRQAGRQANRDTYIERIK